MSVAQDPRPTSHVEALRSSSIIGGSSVIVMLVRMVRTKVVAVWLGPGGVGLEAIFDSVVTLARTFVDLGMSTSGVRQIAAADGAGGDESVSRTAYALRRACWILGTVGAIGLFIGREAISRLAFGSADQSASIGLLSLILVFGAVAGGQGALLTGMRRIGDLARVNVWGTLIGTAASIPIVVVLGRDGIALYMVAAAGAGVLVSWFYVRRIRLPAVRPPARDVLQETWGLLRLGLAFVTTSLMATGALFALRVLVTRTEGVDAAGQFQAASALSMVYVGFILQAMGTDFFPRLTAVASDNAGCNRMVNEQAEVSFLLALPGILATLGLAPWVIAIFYSSQFDAAAEILSWQMAGMFLRLASWPLGFVLMAKGRGVMFVLTDAAAWTVYVMLAWLGLSLFGLAGLGMAFVGLYAFYSVMMCLVVRSVSGFKWSRTNAWLLALGAVTIATALCARLTLVEPWATMVGSVLAILVGLHCLRVIVQLTGFERIRRYAESCAPFAVRRRSKAVAAPSAVGVCVLDADAGADMPTGKPVR